MFCGRGGLPLVEVPRSKGVMEIVNVEEHEEKVDTEDRK